jgi:hypothetical protein
VYNSYLGHALLHINLYCGVCCLKEWNWCSLNERRKLFTFEIHHLKGNNLLKPIYENEMLVILHVVKKWFS